jgi:hypothetical protein
MQNPSPSGSGEDRVVGVPRHDPVDLRLDITAAQIRVQRFSTVSVSGTTWTVSRGRTPGDGSRRRGPG